MSRLSETELESYDIDVLKNIAKEGGINSNLADTMNKAFLIRIILWKDKQTEKWPIGGYFEYKKNLGNSKEKEKEEMQVEKYVPPHKREDFVIPEKEECMIDTSSDSFDWETNFDNTYSGWTMPGDEMKTFTIY